MRTSAPRAVALVCIGTIAASCSIFDRAPPPGETTGKIYVGSPRVSGRERLVNDRREQEEWLQRQLADVDNAQFGINGVIDTRSLSMLAGGLQLKTGPDVDLRRAQQLSQLSLAREQGESLLAAERVRTAAVNQIATQLAKKEIDAKEAASQLSALGVTMGALSTAVSGPASSASAAAGSSSNNVADAFRALAAASPPSPASAVMTGATGSPIELFRDRLALREEIRNELSENALDDTHDLNRHALYRMTFDATVLPDNDTSAWALVEVEVVPHQMNASELWRQYRSYKEQALNDTLQRRLRRMSDFADGCLKQRPASFEAYIDCVGDRAFLGTLVTRLSQAAKSDDTTYQIPRAIGPTLGLSVAVVRNLLLKSADSLKIASNRPEGTPAPVPAPGAASAPAPTPAEELEGFGDRLTRIVAIATAEEFKDSGVHCYYRLATTDPARPAYPPPPTVKGSAAYVMRLIDPPSGSIPVGCESGAADHHRRFADRLTREYPNEPRIYAVTPKDMVQRISDVSARRTASEFLFGLSALAGAGDVSAMVQSAKQNDVLLQALRRQPLVVGFTRRGAVDHVPDAQEAAGVQAPLAVPVTPAAAPSAPAAVASAPAARARNNAAAAAAAAAAPAASRVSFGWVLGPTFSLIGDGSKPAFRHTVRQQSLTATVSVPSWWQKVTLIVRTSWHRESEMLRNLHPAPKPKDFTSYLVALPFRPSSLDGALSESARDRTPSIEVRQDQQILVGQSARLFIRGANVWRSAEVYLGAQRADRIRLMPDMGGLIAEFDTIRPVWGATTPGSTPNAAAVEINLVTSDGLAEVGQATIASAPAATMAVVGIGRRFFGNQVASLSIDPPIRNYRSAELRVKSRLQGTLDVKLADTATGNLAIARDGASATVTAKPEDLKVAPGTPVDLYLMTSTDAAIAPQATLIVANSIYYPAPANAQATAAWGPGAGLRDVLLTLPPSVKEAFRAASTGTIQIIPTMTPKGGEPFVLPSVACTLEPKERGSLLSKDCRFTPAIPATAPQAVKDAVKSSEFALTFKIDGEDAPEVTTTLSPK